MMKIPRAILLAVLVLVAAPMLVEAHHATSMFDQKEVTFQGVVKEFQFTNPHTWLLVDVTNKDGSVTAWGFEGEGPTSMERAGIHRNDFLPGTKVTITGHPMKNGQPAAAWIKAVREDGTVFETHIPPPQTTPPASTNSQ